MADDEDQDQYGGPLNEEEMDSRGFIRNYLEKKSMIFASLNAVRAVGWENPVADDHFEKIRSIAEKQRPKAQLLFFKMMQNIGREMHNHTRVFDFKKKEPRILDIGAAPGGFTSVALDIHKHTQVFAVTLPEQLGGYNFLLSHDTEDARVQLRHLDITSCGLEHGLTEADLSDEMYKEPLWPGVYFDLVCCGGTMTQSMKKNLDSDLDHRTADILRYSQLVVGMRRLVNGGTLILVLHKPESWKIMCILHTLSKFSDIQLFKSRRGHAARSAFYLIAKDIQINSEAAKAAMEDWKLAWYQISMSRNGSVNSMPTQNEPEISEVKNLLEVFGEEFVRLAEPIWSIQNNAIKKTPWFSGKTTKLAQCG